MMEFIQNSPTNMVFITDFIPREDLVLHSDDYLHRYYEQGKLEEIRQSLVSVPSVDPYVVSSLFIRSVMSPSSIVVTVNCKDESEMDLMFRDHVGVVAKKLVEHWLESCANDVNYKPKPNSAEEEEPEVDSEVMIRTKRDNVIKKNFMKNDLSVFLPSLFEKEVADEIFASIIKSLKIESL